MNPLQGTAAWFEAKLGKVGASHISDIMAKTKTGPAASRNNYMVQLVCERLTGEVTEHFTSKAMEWGIAQEENAVTEYEMASGNMVEFEGFVEHPTVPMSGASPDGLVGEEGLIEVKCPLTTTHIKSLLGQDIDRGYILQMHWQMDCTGRKWCEFVSYDPRLPGNLQLSITRVERDDSLIQEICGEVVEFLGQLDVLEGKLRSKQGDGDSRRI